MIQKLAEHRIAFLLLVVLLLVQSFSIDLDNPYRKPINGDAQAYYAYLPAIFIYHDLDYGFVPAMQQKYYVSASAKSFLKDVAGEQVNKTFPGVTVLYAPFFLMAHGISLLFGLPADGYAYTYQLFYLIGFWCYVLLGMILFRNVLRALDISPKIADLSLIILFGATNLFFYTVYDQSVTHLYSFFLINWSVWILLKLQTHPSLSKLTLLGALLALIVITRPTNALVLFLFLFFLPEWSAYRTILAPFLHIKNVLKAIIPALLILSIPFILWKLQTDRWLVYSYGEEGFDFSNPEWVNFLFSYTKGWLLYTPLMALILPFGFGLLWLHHRKRFWLGIAFFAFAIYVFSSWWCWYYGAGMSQRVLMDFYLLPGYLLALLLTRMQQTVALRIAALVTVCVLMTLNTLQAYQIQKGILPFGSPTREQYWNNFLVLQKRAEVYPQAHWAFVSHGTVSLHPTDGQIIKGQSVQLETDWCLQVNQNAEYSAVAQIPTQNFKKGCKLIVSFEARANSSLLKTRVVFQLGDAHQYVFMLADYASTSWEKMQYLIEVPEALSVPVDIYLWNASSGEAADLKNLHWDLYFTETYF